LSAHSTRFYYRIRECAVIKAELESVGFPVIECENESHKSASIYLNPASIIIKIILFSKATIKEVIKILKYIEEEAHTHFFLFVFKNKIITFSLLIYDQARKERK